MKYGPCELCNAVNYEFIAPYPGFEGIDLVRCKQCELMQSQPIPTEEFLNDFYRTEFGNDPNMGFEMTEKFEKGFRLRATLQFDFVNKLCDLNEGKLPKKALDVGCHAGSFLSLFKARGWDVTGVDPNPRSAYADKWYGIKVRNQLFKPGMFEANTFDIILHSHVLEHVRHPKEYFEEFYRILKPGGHVFIEVPNESVEKVKDGSDVNPHLYFFTPKTLGPLAKLAGFEVVATGVLGIEPLKAPLFSKAGFEWLAVRSQARYNAKGGINLFTMLPLFGKIFKEDRYFKSYHPKARMLRVFLRKPLTTTAPKKQEGEIRHAQKV